MKLHADEVEARDDDSCRNVVKVLTTYDGVWTEKLILSALEYVHGRPLMSLVFTVMLLQLNNT